MSGFLSGLFETKAAGSTTEDAIARATGASSGVSYGGWGLGPVGNWDLEKAVKDGIEKVTWVFRCVDVIAQNQAGVPLHQRRGLSRKSGEWIDDPRIDKLLNFRANTYERAWMFRYRLSAILLLSRRGAFIEVLNGKDGRPSQLHLLPPGMTRPIPDPENFVKGYEVTRSDYQVDILSPERVIWLRTKPHPTDPYAQLTPLTAAGLSVDIDYFAHLFNRNFLAQDGRPGMLITIQGNIHPEDAKEIKRRFSGGPAAAGQVTVIESEGVEVADTSASPRDVQWGELLRASKEEILMAFGVPESVMGNASGRTFDNADAERENFWMDTMVPHCNAIGQGLDPLTGDSTDDRVLAYDFSGIDVLQRADRRKREEMRTEISAGVRTINSYFEETGQEQWDVLPANILWHPSGIAIAPTDKQQADIMKLRRVGEPQEPQDPFAQMQQAFDAQFTQMRNDNNAATIRESNPPRQIESRPGSSLRGRAPRAERKRGTRTETKEDDETHRAVIDIEVIDHNPSEIANLREEGVIEGILTTWDERQADVICERLNHVKSRKGTRHWEGEQTETKDLDPGYAVEVDRWVGDITEIMKRRIRRMLVREANIAARDLRDMGVLTAMEQDRAQPPGGRLLDRVFFGKANTEVEMDRVFQGAVSIVEQAARNQSVRVHEKIAKMDKEGASMRQIEKEVRRMIGQRAQWRRALGTNVVTSAAEGAKNAVMGQAKQYLDKTWHAHDDERTRSTHKIADGQSVASTAKFRVGGAWLRYPGDVLGPPQEVINCRCWVSYAPSSIFVNRRTPNP